MSQEAQAFLAQGYEGSHGLERCMGIDGSYGALSVVAPGNAAILP